jgi:hypothetical protein
MIALHFAASTRMEANGQAAASPKEQEVHLQGRSSAVLMDSRCLLSSIPNPEIYFSSFRLQFAAVM